MQVLFEERNVYDVRNWHRDLLNQTFYSICPNDKNKYKTIFFKYNAFTDELQPMISNEVEGVPPDGMKPVPQGALQRAMRMKSMKMFNER